MKFPSFINQLLTPTCLIRITKCWLRNAAILTAYAGETIIVGAVYSIRISPAAAGAPCCPCVCNEHTSSSHEKLKALIHRSNEIFISRVIQR